MDAAVPDRSPEAVWERRKSALRDVGAAAVGAALGALAAEVSFPVVILIAASAAGVIALAARHRRMG